MLTATIILFALGLILLAAELLVIPGFGVAGVGGLVCLFLSAYLGFTHFGAIVGFLMTAAIVAFVVVSLRYLLRSRAVRRMVLDTEVGREEGYVATPPELEALVGRQGTALSTLRPSGVAEIDGTRVDVVSDSEFINAGESIRVVLVDGNRVVVEKAVDGSSDGPAAE